MWQDVKGRTNLDPNRYSKKGLIIIPNKRWTDTGFPGKQIIIVFFILPMAIGLPGLIAAFQKNILPFCLRIFTRWSSSPTEAPPAVIMILCLGISESNIFFILFELSGRLPKKFLWI